MSLIPKKTNSLKASSFRGILLLATVAKRIHAMLRTQLMSALQLARPSGQLGGFRGQLVHFGFHSILTWTNILHQQRYTTAVLYLDLTSAFHHLVRELVLGTTVEADFTQVLRDLAEAGCPVEARYCGQQLIGALEQLGCDARILKLLRDVHTDTWMVLAGNPAIPPIRTKRGTRPGSPLADGIFHVLMAHIMTGVDRWIQQQAGFTALLARHDLTPITVIWADDVAIPWATEAAEEIVPALTQLVRFVDGKFSEHGFTINYELQKTNAVISFQGPQAPACRKDFLLTARPGAECILNNDKTVWLHFKPTYKHLGYTYAASQSFDAELRQRIGQAKQAISLLSRSVLANRHLPKHLRLQLFRALVETKLFYGMGAWRTPTIQQMRTLRTFHIGALKKVLRVPHDEHLSNGQILQRAGAADVRILLAIDRLRYAQRLFSVGPEFLQHLIQVEKAHTDNSWLHGLASDLHWLNELIPHAVPFTQEEDFTAVIDLWQTSGTSWKRTLKRALRISIVQEHMMTDLYSLSSAFFGVLRAGGAEFDPVPDEARGQAREETHECMCGRRFTTPQGLALHRVRAHQQFAPEHNLVCGATCPNCFRFCWTSARLQQHLAYIPRKGGVNRCYQALIDRGYTTEFQAEKLPGALRGVVRLDALVAEGPQAPSTVRAADDLANVRQQIQQLADELIVQEVPEDHLAAGQALSERLTCCTRLWIAKYRGGGQPPADRPDLADWWLRLLFTFGPRFEEWTELVFISWGEHILPDIIAETFDGEIEYDVERMYFDIYTLLPRVDSLTRLTHLKAKAKYIEHNMEAEPVPHRPCRVGTANASERRTTQQKIPSAYRDQKEWLAALRAVKWLSLPADQPLPLFSSLQDQPHILLVHLFSGRRRSGDFHMCMDMWARKRGIKITILSMDTANSISYGNLQLREVSWQRLLECYEKGLVTGTLSGTPCETFSEARHQEPDPETSGSMCRWPRPLRSFDRLLGLLGLSKRELEQLGTGSCFFMQGTLLMAYHLVYGGFYVSEHPAPPRDPSRATIWTSPWISLLRTHPDVALHLVPQWRFGASVVKPTGLLVMRIPNFIRSLYAHADDSLKKPVAVAIGRYADGSYKTSSHKEYPPRFSAGIAQAFADQIDVALRSHRTRNGSGETHAALYKWVQEAQVACSQLRESTSWLPDYQRPAG